MKLVYTAVFTPYEDGGGFAVKFPDLPGCVTGGDDLAEALSMAEDAASGWILGELEEGNAPPKATEINAVSVQDGQFKLLIALDMDAYAAKYGNSPVEKALKIPAWMNMFVETHHINCSQILRESIDRLVTAE